MKDDDMFDHVSIVSPLIVLFGLKTIMCIKLDETIKINFYEKIKFFILIVLLSVFRVLSHRTS